MELVHSQDQLLEGLTLEQQGFHLGLWEIPCSDPACWEDPAELDEVEDASMSLVLEEVGVLELLKWLKWLLVGGVELVAGPQTAPILGGSSA